MNKKYPTASSAAAGHHTSATANPCPAAAELKADNEYCRASVEYNIRGNTPAAPAIIKPAMNTVEPTKATDGNRPFSPPNTAIMPPATQIRPSQPKGSWIMLENSSYRTSPVSM